MALDPDDFQALLQMQRACDALDDDLAWLDSITPRLRDVDARLGALADSYRDDWLRIAVDGDISDEQHRELQALVPPGRYSVLGEDTIWNVLDDMIGCLAELEHLAASPEDPEAGEPSNASEDSAEPGPSAFSD